MRLENNLDSDDNGTTTTVNTVSWKAYGFFKHIHTPIISSDFDSDLSCRQGKCYTIHSMEENMMLTVLYDALIYLTMIYSASTTYPGIFAEMTLKTQGNKTKFPSC